MPNQVHGARILGKRESQEDAYRIVLQSESDPKTDILMLVADGMGGHVGGEIASNLALKTFEKHFISGSQAPKPGDRLRDALVKANDAIAARTREDPNLKGMGCTLIGVLKLGDRILWVSVGDSLIYLLRNGQVRRLNADHSLMGELMEAVEAGKMRLEEARAHPRRNALRSAVIGEPLKLIDSKAIGLEAGDMLVLATDGLDTLSHDTLTDTLVRTQKGEVGAVAQSLLDQVERADKPNQDNTTVVVYRHGMSGRSSLLTDSKWRLGAADEAAQPPSPKLSTLLAGVGIGVAVAALAALFYVLSRPSPPPDVAPLVVETPAETPVETPPLVTETLPQTIGGDTPPTVVPPGTDGPAGAEGGGEAAPAEGDEIITVPAAPDGPSEPLPDTRPEPRPEGIGGGTTEGTDAPPQAPLPSEADGVTPTLPTIPRDTDADAEPDTDQGTGTDADQGTGGVAPLPSIPAPTSPLTE